MSITDVSSVALQETTLLQSVNANTTKAATPAAASSTAPSAGSSLAATDAASEPGSAVTAIAKDLTSLLKSLVSGNVAGAQSDLAKLQADLQTQNASLSRSNGSPDSATVPTSKPVEKLVSEIANALLTGSTSGALQDLASYLVTTGFGTGSLVNTTA